MTGPTHKRFSVSGACIVSMLMYKFGLSQINYYLALPIILLTSKYGALFPDIDHNWDLVKEKTVPNWIINKLIHLTGGKHRSWQTHSIDILIIFTLLSYFIPSYIYTCGKITEVNLEVSHIIMYGFIAGWASHLFSDMLTSAGVRIVCWSDRKLALVPKNIGKLRFNTGNEWEQFVYKFIRIINILLGVTCIIYPFIVPGTYQELLTHIFNT